MELKLLLLFGVCLGLVAHTRAVEGSGDDGLIISGTTTTRTTIVDVDTDSDLDQDASGDDEEASPVLANKAKVLEPVSSGDGGDEPLVQTNQHCEGIWCWCTYTDGTEIPHTRVYVQKSDCSRYANMAAPVSSPQPAVPTRAPVTKAREEHVETQPVTEDDIIFVDETTTKMNNNVPGLGSDSDIDIDTKTDEKQIDIDNNIPSSVDIGSPSEKDKIEKEEEETNWPYGTGYLKGEGDIVKEEWVLVSHPGILAALIGGGVVGLLCFVLIILFIVYRVRKKDEGSYPLGDEKPLKNYAYSKAPSQEFYA